MDVDNKNDGSRNLFRFYFAILSALVLTSFGCGPESKSPDSVLDLPTTKTNACASEQIPNSYLVHWESGDITVRHENSVEQLKTGFIKPNLALIRRVEPNYKLHALEPMATESSVSTTDPDLNWGTKAINASKAWDQNIKGENVIVAVVDSGVDIGHPQLKNQIAVNEAELNGKAGVDDDSNGFIDDIYGWNFSDDTPNNKDEIGHGTHVSGIIAADPAAGPVFGVAPKAKILPLDFMNQEYGSTAGAISAIKYAVKRGAKVINASWGGEQCSKTLQTVIEGLDEKNVLFLAAAGNSRSNLATFPEYPAAFDAPSQITVGATTIEFIRAGFSNYGAPVHVMAPGSHIISTFPSNQLAKLDGTSMATPFVAGQAALLFSFRPNATAHQIREAILSATQFGNFLVQSKGEIRIDLSLEKLKAALP